MTAFDLRPVGPPFFFSFFSADKGFSYDGDQYFIVVSCCAVDPQCLSVNLRSSLRVATTGPVGLINRAGLLTPVFWLRLPLGSHISLNPWGHDLYNSSEPMDKGSIAM